MLAAVAYVDGSYLSHLVHDLGGLVVVRQVVLLEHLRPDDLGRDVAAVVGVPGRRSVQSMSAPAATCSMVAEERVEPYEVRTCQMVAEERVEAAVAAGGTLVTAEHAPAFWVLADAHGNKVCVCTADGRDLAEE